MPLDELGATVSTLEPRSLASEARQLAQNPAFTEACRLLTLKYWAIYQGLTPDDPLFERQCVRVQYAISIIGDITGQLAVISDNQRLDDANLKMTARGNKNGR